MPCSEYRELLHAYASAVRQHSVALNVLKMATPDNLETLYQVVECAHEATTLARVALEEHCAQHGCTLKAWIERYGYNGPD